MVSAIALNLLNVFFFFFEMLKSDRFLYSPPFDLVRNWKLQKSPNKSIKNHENLPHINSKKPSINKVKNYLSCIRFYLQNVYTDFDFILSKIWGFENKNKHTESLIYD